MTTLMQAANLVPTTISNDARQRFIAAEGKPFLMSDWLDVLFVHYEMDPDVLAPLVPFELDLRDGRAYVSLVAFTLRHMRVVAAGPFASLLGSPVTDHGFLNVRTYVKHEGEPGIYFLAEWLSNRVAVALGPRTFGLPYRHGTLEYENSPSDAAIGDCHGYVADLATGARFEYHGRREPLGELRTAEPGSLDEFLLERYTAYTEQRCVRRRFRVWHAPWPHTPIAVDLFDDSLIGLTGPWLANARLIGADWSPGATDIWMSRPQCINGPACDTSWTFA